MLLIETISDTLLRTPNGKGSRILLNDATAESILDRLGDQENYPHDALVPYKEFEMGRETYYFTPGGFLYRKDPWSQEVCGFFAASLAMRSGTTGPPMAGGTDRLSRSPAITGKVGVLTP